MRDRATLSVALVALVFGVAHCGFAQSLGESNDPRGGVGGGASDTTASGAAGTGGETGPATHASEETLGPNTGAGGQGALDGCSLPADQLYYLSADDSNSMASPAHVRELLRAGEAPSPSSIRTYEFLNYYNVTFPAPNTGKLGVTTLVAPGLLPNEYFVTVGIQAALPTAPPPLSVTLVVDTSGSMTGESIERAKAAMKGIATSLRDGDVVSLVTWEAEVGVRLDGLVIGNDTRPELVDAIDQLVTDGASDLAAGLETGYALAAAHKRDDGLNRLVLISDGGAGTKTIDRDLIASYASDADLRGIYLVGVGTGPAKGYNDTLMDFVTDAGRGAYVYADSVAEAKHVFQDRFEEVMDVAARDVRLELTLPGYLTIQQFFGEGYSTDPAAVVPQHLAPGDSMVFSQVVTASCDVNAQPGGKVIARATFVDPETGMPDAVETAAYWYDLASKPPAGLQLEKARAIVAYAEALKSLDTARLFAAHELIVAANAHVAEANNNVADPDLTEIEALIQLHPGFN